MIQTFVAADNASANFSGTSRSSGAAWIVPALCLRVTHIGKTGTSDLVGKICPQALLRELPLDVLAELRHVGQTRDAAELGLPSSSPS